MRSHAIALVAALALGLAALQQQPVSAQDCSQAKPPIFLLPGLMGSNLLGDKKGVFQPGNGTAAQEQQAAAEEAAAAAAAEAAGNPDLVSIYKAVAEAADHQPSASAQGLLGDCPLWRMNSAQVWLPTDPNYLLYSQCFYYMMKLNYNKATGKFSNNTDVALWANPGGADGTDYAIFKIAGYDKLMEYIAATFSYTLGRNLFALPYDFRQDLTCMSDSSGQLQMLADRVAAAVRANCGKKAIVIGHSMGTIVSLGLLRSPKLQQWREQNVKGYLALAPPFGGAVPAVNGRISGQSGVGAKTDLAKLIGDLLFNILWKVGQGLPSVVMLLPYAQSFGGNWFDFYNQVHSFGATVAAGPVPGIETYCIYGARIDTIKAYAYSTNIVANQRMTDPAQPLVVGKGDGTVNLESLRLCRKITTLNKITELQGNITHTSVITDSRAQAAVGRALRNLIAA